MQIHPPHRRPRPAAEISVPVSGSDLRHSYRTSLTLAVLIAVVFGIIMVIYIVRQNPTLKTTIVKDDMEDLEIEGEKAIYDDCIDVLWENLLRHDFSQNDPSHLQPIRIKVFYTFRHVSRKYKQELILFLYEQGLIRTDTPFERPLNLYGADLKDIQFKDVNLDYLYLPGVIASKSHFTNCQLKYSNFRDSVMDESQFKNCSLEKSIFSGASLKISSFKHSSGLSGIDFTNTDLLNSDIQIDENILMNTRLPDGRVSTIDSRELIIDGEAGQQCNSSQSSHWSKESEHSLLTIGPDSKLCTLPKPNSKNNCVFYAHFTSRLTQDIDLARYSILIDNNQIWYEVSAYSACSNEKSNDSVTIELRFANKRNFYDHKQTHIINNGTNPMNSSTTSSIPIGTRAVKITIGVNIDRHLVQNNRTCCAIDDIRFHIF